MRTKTLTTVILISVLSFVNTSCSMIGGCTEAEGERITKTLDLDKFSEIEVNSSTHVIITQGETQVVEITAAPNIIKLLNQKVKSKEWEIKFDKCVANTNDIEIRITIPTIDELSINGSGSIKSDGKITANSLELSIEGSGSMELDVEVKELESHISGSGDLSLKGSTKLHSIEVNGSGDINSYEMSCDEAEVEINGSGDVKLNASYSLEIEVNGSGDVYYKGDVKKINSDINGSGKLRQAE